MYAGILSDVLLEQEVTPHLPEVKQAITSINKLIVKNPKTRAYKKLKTELVHLKELVTTTTTPSKA
jgi:hypothetical protein